MPLFEQYDLDLALESDGHSVKRTLPIRAEAHDPTGVVYIGEGGLGVPQRDPQTERWFLQEPGMSGKSHHIVLLEFGDGYMTSRIMGLPESQVGPFTPTDHVPLIESGATWRYLAGADPEGEAWRGADFDDSSWKTGAAGFGYADEDDVTILEDMHGEYTRVYLRASFEASALKDLSEVQLAARYDDGFIAYINGVEVTRSSVGSGSGPAVEGVEAHEAKGWELFPLGSGADLASRVGEGRVVLAIEGHNKTKSSSDFTLDPCLIGPPLKRAQILDEAILLDELRLSPREDR